VGLLFEFGGNDEAMKAASGAAKKAALRRANSRGDKVRGYSHSRES
jgi:hypothetical protein